MRWTRRPRARLSRPIPTDSMPSSAIGASVCRAVSVSGLVLARALIVHPSVLILDEATSALDALNEAAILTTIGSLKGRLTIVLITHRIAATRSADLVYVLEADASSSVAPGPSLRRGPTGRSARS